MRPSLVLLGRIVNGRPILNLLLVQTRPALPARPGPYGSRSMVRRHGCRSRRGHSVVDAVGDEDTLRSRCLLSRRGGQSPTSGLRRSDRFERRGLLGGATNRTAAARECAGSPNASSCVGPSPSPMILLRDAATREVLALARNRTLQVPARRSGMEVHVSHRASSQRLVLPDPSFKRLS